METGRAIKTINKFCSSRFDNFKLGKRLSDFAHTYLLTADNNEYVIKLVEYRNVVSLIRHDPKHVRAIITLAREIKRSTFIKTVSIIDYFIAGRYSILLLKRDKLSAIHTRDKKFFETLGRSIFKFHAAGSHVFPEKLPWNRFPGHFKKVLKKLKRWDKVNEFLKTGGRILNKYDARLVTCHNDIHAGNIFWSKNKLVFLDLDDISREPLFSDLGMAIANFTDSKYSKQQLLSVMGALLIGYGLIESERNRLLLILFALRKLYFTEAYFYYLNQEKKYPIPFVFELKKREAQLTSLVKDYL